MKKSQLLKRFPRASQCVLALNGANDEIGAASITGDPGAIAELERNSRRALDENRPYQGGYPAKHVVRVTSVRKCLLDEDNLCEKFHVDGLRYAGLIPADDPGTTRIETTQRLCRPGEEEKTLIEIYREKPEDNTTL